MEAKPTNRFSAGTLVQGNSPAGVAIFTGYDMRPGQVRTARARIANAGSAAARFKLVELDASDGFDAGDLSLAIHEVGPQRTAAVYEGAIGQVPAAGIHLGRFEPGEERAYYFTASFVPGALDLAPGDRNGRGAGAAYEWEAVPDGS